MFLFKLKWLQYTATQPNQQNWWVYITVHWVYIEQTFNMYYWLYLLCETIFKNRICKQYLRQCFRRTVSFSSVQIVDIYTDIQYNGSVYILSDM